jgi:hypothetical protein
LIGVADHYRLAASETKSERYHFMALLQQPSNCRDCENGAQRFIESWLRVIGNSIRFEIVIVASNPMMTGAPQGF